MSEIPADVMEAAAKAVRLCEKARSELEEENAAVASICVIARAIMAERERCAKVADGVRWTPGPDTSEKNAQLIGYICKDVAGKIAAFIRRGEP